MNYEDRIRFGISVLRKEIDVIDEKVKDSSYPIKQKEYSEQRLALQSSIYTLYKMIE